MSVNKRISELEILETSEAADLIPIVDDSEVDIELKTKGQTKENFLKEVQEDIDDHIGDNANPHAVTKTQVGLGSADNTSDLNKPISTATQAAITAHTSNTSNPHSVTKAQVGLGNVANSLQATKTEFDTHVADVANPHAVTKAQVGLGNVTNDAQIPLSQKAAANGVATLGADQKIPSSQLPALALTDTFVVLNQAEMLALTAETGDVAIRVDQNKSYILQGANPATLAHWKELLTPTDAVLSVNGQTGAITLTTTNISEGTNLYHTDARARASISATAPLSYNNTTGVMSMPAAATAQNGYLTSTDWNTFNNKVSSQWVTSGSNIYFNSGNVGIGDTTPDYLLDVAGTLGVEGAATFASTINNSGDITNFRLLGNDVSLILSQNQVGAWKIKNTATTGAFDISHEGTSKFSIPITGVPAFPAGLSVTNVSGSGTIQAAMLEVFETVNNTAALLLTQNQIGGSWAVTNKATSGDFAIKSDGSAGTDRLTILYTNGNVGIGTTNPGEKLHVNGNIRLEDAFNIFGGSTTGMKIGTATTQKIGFWNKTPVVQPASASQALLTDSTGGSNDGTVSAVSGTGDDATINNNFKEFIVLTNEIRNVLVNTGLMKGSA